ncbi:class I SAM-dependent methyltransferase [Tahibacter amnicola]|uniref:Class I SAM-dependent methyltransferase n=1 Tax=Tahibacter amnicola TaxID=2976241 RepID=A0ABY6BHZ5_9GAMM|nr:class I SAM-dependent methyltransferase [Tahibacter amnicola]UXI69621.1 class I SAM-dependent methyltransferase [Tahibacter amnicola]
MPESPPTLFDTEPLRRLLEHELAAIAPELGAVFGRQGLFLRSCPSAPQALTIPMLGGVTRLFVASPDRLGGDATCQATALPFADDSFRLVLVQHAAEVVADPDALREELARVLEPGGIVMILGFRPLSAWRPWLMLQNRRYSPLTLCSSGGWRDALADVGVDAYASRRIGPLLHRPAMAAPSARRPRWQSVLSPLRPSWLLLARKRTFGPRLEPGRISLREPAVRPRLASGTQRACA